MMIDLRSGDCREVMAGMDAESVDAVVTDPPYELAFMGKGWDSAGVSFDPETWRAAHRVLKPGGHLLAFGGTRTVHRIAVAIEDAGFEIRDCLSWLYGSGFPKSHNVGNGIGTALKPAWEPVIVARKPLRGTVAQNVAQHGTGGINVDACRIESELRMPVTGFNNRSFKNRNAQANNRPWMDRRDPDASAAVQPHPAGRWPANVALDEAAAAMLDEMSGVSTSPQTFGRPQHRRHDPTNWQRKTGSVGVESVLGYGDTGGASRFFYVAKASRSERNAGLAGMPAKPRYKAGEVGGTGGWRDVEKAVNAPPDQNHHPTVKPVALMRWLVRLVTPPDGLVLDPFMGSGTTGIAATLEGFAFVGIEQDADYLAIAERRIAHWTREAADDTRQLALTGD